MLEIQKRPGLETKGQRTTLESTVRADDSNLAAEVSPFDVPSPSADPQVLDQLRILRKAVETTQLGVTITDPEGRILFVNRADAEMHGYTVEELVGEDVRRLAPEELWSPMSDGELREVRSLRRETINRRRDGSLFPVELLSDVVTNETGEPIAVVTTCQDISHRKQVERSLRILSKAVETTQLGLTITDPDGRILFANRAEAETHGTTVEELIGKDVRMLAPRELWNPMGLDKLRQLKSRQRETVNVRSDGTTFPVQLLSDVVTDEHGDPIAVVTTCQDISRRRQAEADQAQLEDQLRQSQKMEAIGQLAGGVAHDFNNLLVVIQGHTEFALAELPEDLEGRDHLDHIQTAARRAARLTRQLLAFSRSQVLQPIDLELNDVVSDLLKILRRLIGEHIELRLVPGAALGTVHADLGQIEQVVMNLCLNARDALVEGGSITLETSNVEVGDAFCAERPWARPGSYVRLRVEDTGTGFDEEVHRHLFDPFFTTKAVGKGTGLGLATAYGIVKQHQGMIDATSRPGEGACFDVYLPRVERQPVLRSAPRVAPGIGGDETLLVAEDDAMVRAVLVQLLRDAGYTVLTAGDGVEAVELFARHRDSIDLVFLDMVMPRMGGVAAQEEIRALRPDARFLFCTGYSSQAPNLPFPPDDRTLVVDKPYDRDHLLRSVRRALAG